MNPVAITLLLAAALAGFAALAWRKLAIVVALAPEPRFDRPLGRLRSVLRNGFLQSRMVRREWKPGLMHAVIFLGFVTLLARKVELLVIGYDADFVYPGLAGGAFAALKDAVELAVLAAVAYALWRRFVQKPARLERNREAVLILGLIAAIMVTDFAFDAFRFALFSADHAAIAHERGFAFAGDALARLVAPLDAGVLKVGHQALYWVQMSTVLAFLVILPLGEHFHIVTALPALYFRRGGPANRVPPLDLDRIMGESEASDEAAMKIGVRTARDLTWKDGLDAFTCTECGRCKDACPTFLTGKPLSLKWVHDGVKRHLVAERRAILAGEDEKLPPLVGGVVSEDALWACTTCGYCEAACPIELEHLPRFYRLRQHQVLMEGAFPRELKAVFEAYGVQSNPWGLPAESRGEWATGLDVPVVETAEDVLGLDYLFYVGSAESFDPRARRIAVAFAKVLRHAGVRFGILGARETSTGECVRRAGNEMLFQQLARSLVETLNGLGVTRIVTCDPHAFNTLKNEYPEFGGRYKVVHHTQLIARLLREGKLKLARSFERVIYHEPCYLARHNGEYEAPRAVLAELTRDAPLEFALRREKAMCCGAGGGRMWMEEKIGSRINVLRFSQALAFEPRVVATACPYCATMMDDAAKTLGRDAIATRDIAELVAEALEPPSRQPGREGRAMKSAR
ncbi:MAG TPA: (Fe-S)-binding protein [Casimicrobiaceae bacterium]|nr:(Fe-S)-binding protein [Casimicrobiaceae bacterium]